MAKHLQRMALVTILTVCGLAGLLAAQSTSTPEHFTALAINFDAPTGAASTTVDIVVNRWTTDAEKDRLMTMLLEKGPQAMLDALKDMKSVGSIRTPDSIGYDLRFARKTSAPEGGENIVIMTDRPIGFWEAANRPRSIDYPFTVIEMRVGRDGKGEGKISIGTKILADRDTNTIVLENYTMQPVRLSALRRIR